MQLGNEKKDLKYTERIFLRDQKTQKVMV